MGGEWEYKPIDEVAEKVAMGPFGSSIKVSTFVTEGVPILSGQHLNETQVQDGENNFITHAHADKLRNANVFRGDVIFTHAGNIGQVAYIPKNSRYERYVISQRQFYMRCNTSKILPEFVAYYFKSPQGQHKLLANSTPSGVPSIARPVTYLRSIEIPVPTILEQKRVVQMLVSVDNKIEANRKINKTLEEIAQAIFKHWFIDFEFPNENGEPYKSSGGEMIDSPLGPIPKEWRIGKIEDVCEFSYGKALKADKRIQGRIPVYGSNGQIGWHNESLVSGPGIIVGRKGNPGLIHWSEEDFFPIDTTFYVVPRVGKSIMHFLYFALEHADLPRLSADSAVPGLNRNIAYMQQLVIPAEQLLRDFENRISIIFDQLQTNSWQNQSLSELRDTLLPKLMSGEIRVPVSEKEDDQL